MNYHQLAKEIERLQPGQCYRVSKHTLADLGVGPERIMDNIVGGAYEFRFWTDPMSGDCIFERLREPLNDGRQTYVEEDRQVFFALGSDGFYRRRGEVR